MSDKLIKSNGSYRHGNLREAILATSLQIVEKEGIESLSIREAAKKAGVTHQAPYRHFTDREALLAALAARGFRELYEHIESRVAVAKEPLERLCCAGEAYAAWSCRHPEHFRLMFSPSIPDYESDSELKEITEKMLGAVLGLVSQCQQSGVIRQDDPRPLARQFWAAIHGVSILHVDRQFKPLRDDDGASIRLARQIVLNLVQGLKPR